MDRSAINRTDLRDVTSDNDDALEEYGRAHIKIAQACAGTTGLLRSQNLAIFNDSYRKGRDIRYGKKTIFTYKMDLEEQNSRPEFGYLLRVLRLCATSDICTKLGMSAIDLMNLDLDTFTFIEEYFNKLSDKENKETGNILNELKMNKM